VILYRIPSTARSPARAMARRFGERAPMLAGELEKRLRPSA
jgi:hypothetical protein